MAFVTLLGVLMLGCGTGGVTVAESLGATSGIAAMMVATMPLFTVVFGYLWRQRASALEWAGIFLGLFGIALLNRGANLQAAPLAAMLLLLAPAGWASDRFGAGTWRNRPASCPAQARCWPG